MKKGLSNSFSCFLVLPRRGDIRAVHAPGIAGPVVPGAEYLFDDVAHAAVPARELRNVARGFDHLGCRIRGTDGDSDCLHTLQVRDVVAHVDCVPGVDALLGEAGSSPWRAKKSCMADILSMQSR